MNYSTIPIPGCARRFLQPRNGDRRGLLCVQARGGAKTAGSSWHTTLSMLSADTADRSFGAPRWCFLVPVSQQRTSHPCAPPLTLRAGPKERPRLGGTPGPDRRGGGQPGRGRLPPSAPPPNMAPKPFSVGSYPITVLLQSERHHVAIPWDLLHRALVQSAKRG